MIEILKTDFSFVDERGKLFQLVHGNIAQVNYVESVPGGHYHKLNKETFYIISGEVIVTASLGNETEQMTFHTGDMFAIDINIMHSFDYKAFTRMIVMYDKGIELSDGEKDIYS